MTYCISFVLFCHLALYHITSFYIICCTFCVVLYTIVISLRNKAGLYILQLWFLLLLFFHRLFSVVTDWMFTILPHMMWPQCKFRMWILNVLHVAHEKYKMQKCIICGCAPPHNCCPAISLQLRHVWTMRKVKQQYLLHMSSQYAELCPPPNGWNQLESLGHPSKFQRVSLVGFVTALMLLSGG